MSKYILTIKLSSGKGEILFIIAFPDLIGII